MQFTGVKTGDILSEVFKPYKRQKHEIYELCELRKNV